MPDQVAAAVDLTDCAREPIHVPGFTQQFGVLLAMPATGDRITQIGVNTSLVFGLEPAEVVGQRLGDLLGEDNAAVIKDAIRSGDWKERNPLKMTLTRLGEPLPVNVIVHRYDGLDFVEIEPLSLAGAISPARSFQLVQGSLLRLQSAPSAAELWDLVAAEVHRITGYDRVMVYKFDRDNHGHVIAERKRDDRVSYLGLHYPASDIPEQARRLYRENWVRYIPDTHYRPVPLIPNVDEDHQRLTDLTHCVLRSVSPVHCEYLHNMGVAASMSVSILREGHLWGLIACHNETPRYLPYELRAACELLGQMLSMRIAALEDTEECAYKSRTNAMQAEFLARLPLSPDIASALVTESPNLLEFIPATGAAVCFGDRISTLGSVPSDDDIRLILESTLERIAAPIFVSDRLQDRMVGARKLTATASGLLCFTASRAHRFHVLWFRTEQVQVMRWSGEPTKAVEQDGATLRLSPRKSFAEWRQEVRGKSQPWHQNEVEAAAELRATLMSLLLAPQGERPGSSA